MNHRLGDLASRQGPKYEKEILRLIQHLTIQRQQQITGFQIRKPCRRILLDLGDNVTVNLSLHD
jgi:hypothetical protein